MFVDVVRKYIPNGDSMTDEQLDNVCRFLRLLVSANKRRADDMFI